MQYVGLSVFLILIGLDLKIWSYFEGKSGDVIWSAILGTLGDTSYVAGGAAGGAAVNTRNNPLGLHDYSSGSSPSNSENSSPILDDLMNRDSYRKYPIDCSEIAEDLYNAAGGKGQILHIEAQEGWLNVETYGISEAYSYHEVYSINGLIYDPRYSSTPVTKAEYFNMINNLNKGGFVVWTI